MKFKTTLKKSRSFIDLTPLVDVIFLMLVFFIVTSDILPLKSLNVENPELDRTSTPMTSQIIVVMDAQNVIYLGPRKDITSLVGLKASLINEVAVTKKQNPGVEPTIVLSVDKSVEYGPFLRMFSAAQSVAPRYALYIGLQTKPSKLPRRVFEYADHREKA